MREFRNQTRFTQVIYNRSGNPVEVRRGQTISGDEYAKWSPPLTEVTVATEKAPAVVAPIPEPKEPVAIELQEPKKRKGGRRNLNTKGLVPES